MSKVFESRGVVLLLALCVILAASGRAQYTGAKPGADSSSSPETTAPPKTKQQTSLLDATRVSTEEAAKSAAQERAGKTADPRTTESSSNENVTEFHPAPSNRDQKSGAAATTSDDSKKSGLKRVHGTVEGSSATGASGGREGGASMGATTKSGKTAVYVETDQSRRDPSH